MTVRSGNPGPASKQHQSEQGLGHSDLTVAHSRDVTNRISHVPPRKGPVFPRAVITHFSSGQCPSGSQWQPDVKGCIPCPVGSYRADLQSDQCSACAAGHSTVFTGGLGPESCLPQQEVAEILLSVQQPNRRKHIFSSCSSNASLGCV